MKRYTLLTLAKNDGTHSSEWVPSGSPYRELDILYNILNICKDIDSNLLWGLIESSLNTSLSSISPISIKIEGSLVNFYPADVLMNIISKSISYGHEAYVGVASHQILDRGSEATFEEIVDIYINDYSNIEVVCKNSLVAEKLTGLFPLAESKIVGNLWNE